MEKVTITVRGMSCNHCKAAVEQGLTKINGVSKAEVSLEDKNVTVTHDGSVALGQLKKAIDDLGYEAL